MSRGLKNCNPGNIRLSSIDYQGEVMSSDTAFKQFGSMKWGYRAMFVLLHTYKVRHGAQSLKDMIYRWAPPSENETEIYVACVAREARVDPAIELDTLQREVMLPIVAAMSRVENGTAASWSDVEQGWDLFITDYK